MFKRESPEIVFNTLCRYLKHFFKESPMNRTISMNNPATLGPVMWVWLFRTLLLYKHISTATWLQGIQRQLILVHCTCIYLFLVWSLFLFWVCPLNFANTWLINAQRGHAA